MSWHLYSRELATFNVTWLVEDLHVFGAISPFAGRFEQEAVVIKCRRFGGRNVKVSHSHRFKLSLSDIFYQVFSCMGKTLTDYSFVRVIMLCRELWMLNYNKHGTLSLGQNDIEK